MKKRFVRKNTNVISAVTALEQAQELIFAPMTFQAVASLLDFGILQHINKTPSTIKDIIKDFGCPEGGNGYTFHDYNSKDFEYSIRRAINDYRNKEDWSKKVKRTMESDFSWERSMDNYVKIYKDI